MENGTYHWTPNGGDEKPSRSKGPSGKQMGRILTAAVVLVLVLVTASTCWYTVDDKHQAPVTSVTLPKVVTTA